MNPAEFEAYPTGNLCNANPAVRALAPAIKALIPGKRVAGRARTVRIVPGENAAIHRAVHEAEVGDLLVVDGAASERYGPFGDLLADCCKAKGIVGAVFDCTVRDSADIAALGFQVFCRGFHPEPTGKTDPGEINVAVTVGGVRIEPADIIVGDDDGVVVVPADIAATVLEEAKAVAAGEETIRARIHAGETTFDIFRLSHAASAQTGPSGGAMTRPETFFNFANLTRGVGPHPRAWDRHAGVRR